MTRSINYLSSVDLTTLFKSCVKTIKTRDKAIGVSYPLSKIFPKAPSSQIFNRAKDILDNIYGHENLLCDHRKKYVVDNANSLSDMERSYMDKVIAKNLKFIEENIRTLEADIKDVTDKQCTEHCKECYLGIINILRSKYLKTTASFRDMKDLHLRKRKAREQLFKLQRPNGSKRKPLAGVEKIKPITRHKTKENIGLNQSEDEHEENQCNEEQLLNSKIKGENDSSLNCSYLDEEVDVVLSSLSEDDRQLLEQENDHLYQELMSNQEEVKHITRQVVELSRMQDMLTENVDIQAQQIEEIHETILHSTDNVQRGNEEVREAMRKDAGFRVWIMFFLIVMSFTILFLDWYNP